MIRPSVDMMEALRLTRQGKLEEAMAVLRGASPASERSDKREANEVTEPVLDMVPPSRATRKRLDGTAYQRGVRRDATRRRWAAAVDTSAGFLNRLHASSTSQADGMASSVAG